MKASGRLFPMLAFALATVPAIAAEDIGEALRACRAESEDAQRLACYDRVAGRVQAPAPAAAPAPTPAPSATTPKSAPSAAAPAAAATTTAAAAAAPEDNFGRERATAAEEQKHRNDAARELGELTALVAGIDTRMDGLMTITLDNGQVWRQNTPDSKFRLKTGDQVRIQPGSLNSFILSGPSNRSTRVTRMK